MPFSIRSERAIQEFASTMGLSIEGLTQESYRFKFPEIGNLILTATPSWDGLLMSLVFKVEQWHDELGAALLSLAQTQRASGHEPRCGLTDRNEAVLTVALDDDEISVYALDQSLQKLLALRAQFD